MPFNIVQVKSRSLIARIKPPRKSSNQYQFYVNVTSLVYYLPVSSHNRSTSALPVAFSILLLGSLFTEFWKRKQARCAMRWGMSGFEEQEQTRPQYKGIRCDEVATTIGMGVAENSPPVYSIYRGAPEKLKRLTDILDGFTGVRGITSMCGRRSVSRLQRGSSAF